RGHRCARRGPRRTPGRTADPVVGVRADRPHGRVRRGADHPRSRRLVTPALQNRGPLHTRCATGLVRAAMHMPPGCTCTCRTACRPCTCTPGLHATCTPPCTIPTCMWYVAHTRSGNQSRPLHREEPPPCTSNPPHLQTCRAHPSPPSSAASWSP